MPINNSTANNADVAEVAKFNTLAEHWWDLEGPCKPLHEINPHRLNYILERTPIAGKTLLDVGCGGGILTEALARLGASATGIDLAHDSILVADKHAKAEGLNIEYRQQAIAEHAQEHPAHYDVITCLELLEHVPDPAAVVRDCATMIKPGGHLIFSTINRTLKAYGQAVIAAEYLLSMLDKGTHDYDKFIKPSELASYCRASGLTWQHAQGLTYNPLLKKYRLCSSIDVNYLAHCVKMQ